MARSSFCPRQVSHGTSVRPLSRMPKGPRKFHIAQPQPASRHSWRPSRIQSRTILWGGAVVGPELPDHDPDAAPFEGFPGIDALLAEGVTPPSVPPFRMG